MKKIIAGILLAGMLISDGLIYPQTLYVTAVEEEVVYLETFTGIEYTIPNEGEDWIAGDIASAIMCSMGTEYITDDHILSIRYTGYIQ